jgi:hypothetical protein
MRRCVGLAVFEWHFKFFSHDNCRVFKIGIVGGGYFPACRKSVSFSVVITVTKKAITVTVITFSVCTVIPIQSNKQNIALHLYNLHTATHLHNLALQNLSERFVKEIMKGIKKCPKIQHFQALPQYLYLVLFNTLHIVFYQTDNFIIHTFPALSAVMK